MENSDLLTFKAISEFVEELGECFGKKQKSLALYARLISKTTISHKDAIQRHVKAFKEFCIVNRDAILAKDCKKFTTTNITFSKNVFINIEHVFKLADMSETIVVWRYLLTLSALVDENTNARDVLKNMEGEEGNFIAQAMDDIKKAVGDSENVDKSNPMGVAMSLLSSGALTNLVSGITSGVEGGNLDIGKLMGSVQSMLTGLQGDSGDGKSSPDIAGLLSSLSKQVPSEAPTIVEEVVEDTIDDDELLKQLD
jgi:hypothetical protein